MPELPATLSIPGAPRAVFRPRLPWLAALGRRAHTRFRSRWIKRLAKRPTRALFDVLHDGFGLDCTITVEAEIGGEARAFTCTLDQLHFFNAWGLYGAVYEPEVSGLLDHAVRAGDTVYDIGANWGYFAVRVAARPGFQGAVHAFEPMPGTARDARETVRALGLDGTVTVHERALSDRRATLAMATPDARDTGIARIVDGLDGNAHAIEAWRLDDLDLPRPDVMKVDIEGHEQACFEGATDTLATKRPVVIFESWYTERDAGWRAPLQTLTDAGYALYDPVWHADQAALLLTRFEPDGRPALGEHRNVLAIHPDRADRLTGG